MLKGVVAIVVCGAGVAALTGCEGSYHATTARVSPAAGGSWNAVLPGAALGASQGSETPAWILSRNDTALNPRTVDPVLGTTDWPDVDRPSLERPILIRVYEQPGRYRSYGPQHRSRTTYGRRTRY